jgi:hypothetical protein
MYRYRNYDEYLRRDARMGNVQRALTESAFGVLVGAVTGAIGGLPGVVVGAVMGGLVGLLAAVVAAREDVRAAIRDRALDAEIGVTRGSLGTNWVRHRPARGTIPMRRPMSERGANWW